MSSVKSSGKPYVSYNVKASTPEISERFAFLVSSITLSNRRIPVSNVRKNDSSSSLITFSISDC